MTPDEFAAWQKSQNIEDMNHADALRAFFEHLVEEAVEEAIADYKEHRTVTPADVEFLKACGIAPIE